MATPQGRITFGIKAGMYLVIFIIGIIIIKKLIDFVAPGTSDYRKEIKRSNLSYSESGYQTMADAIFRACHGWGTEESVIYRTLGYLKTIDDWNKLVAVYGKDEDGYRLPGRLIYELDRREQEKVNQILSNVGAQI